MQSLKTSLAVAATAFLSAPLAQAQYTSDFESVTASAAGTTLTGQDGYYLPAGTMSADFLAHTYAGNPLGVPTNPTGGAQFIAGNGPGSPTFARAQRDLTWGAGKWTMGFDILATYTGTLPSAQNVGSVSIQPFPGSQALIALARWVDPATADSWSADYVWFDGAGAQLTESVGDPAFQGLAVDRWYRWETDLNLVTNQVLEVRITDIVAGTTSSFNPVDRYLEGGMGGSVTPTGFRFFGGGGVPGNVLCFDNPAILPCPDILHYTFDSGDATNSAVPGKGSPVGTPGTGVAFGSGGLCNGGDGAAISTATGTDCQIDTGWVTDLGTGDWTVGCFLDWSGQSVSSTTLQYIFGDNTAGSFRCFKSGVAGADGLLLRGPVADVPIPGGGATSAPVHVAYCYDSAAAEVRAYLNGVLVSTVAQGTVDIQGTAPFTVMRYSGSPNSMSAGTVMDDFRLYRRCITAGELAAWVDCGNFAVGQLVCSPATANSTGVPAAITAFGTTSVATNSLTLRVTDLPQNSNGFFITSNEVNVLPNPGGVGDICIASFTIGRYDASILNSGMGGAVQLGLDLTTTPQQPGGPVAVMSGETRYWQYWYRDMDPTGAPTSNFSDAVCVSFQ